MMQRPVWCVASVERATHDRRVPGHLVCQQVDFLPLSHVKKLTSCFLYREVIFFLTGAGALRGYGWPWWRGPAAARRGRGRQFREST